MMNFFTVQSLSVLSILLLSSMLSEIQACEPLYLGIIGEYQCQDNKEPRAQILFQKKGSTWEKHSNNMDQAELEQLAMNFVFAGKNLDQTQLQISDKESLYTIMNTNLPKLESIGGSYAGWCDTPSRRPTVIISQPMKIENSGLMQIEPHGKMKVELYDEFVRTVGEVKNCQGGDYKDFDFSEKDIELFDAYQDDAGNQLIAIGFRSDAYRCEGPIDKDYFYHWYFISNDSISFIGDQITYLDSGDYDNNGDDEVIFWYSDFSHEGYILFHDDFKKKIENLHQSHSP